MDKKLCTRCYAEFIEDDRVVLGYLTCMPCGEEQARKKKHTVVPLPKSNYVVVSDLSLLLGLNSSHKGGR